MTTAALIGVQLEIGPEVLASPAAYRTHLEEVAACAVEEGGAADTRVVVFPELIGHLALLALAPPAAQKSRTLASALASAAMRRPLEMLRGVSVARTLGPRHAVLAALAPDGERWWRAVMAPLAKRLNAYLVAGSHLRLAASGDLTNASLLYAPDGRLIATTDKVNLVAGVEDLAPGALGLARGDVERVPIVDTPAGRLATLIGYDVCCAPATPTERFVPVPPVLTARGGVAIVANPTTSPRSAPTTLAETRCARFAITAQLVGRVLDLAYDGHSEIVERHDGEVRSLARAATSDHGGHVVAVVSC